MNKTIKEVGEDSGIVIGRNAVRELLASGAAVDKIFIKRGENHGEGSIEMLIGQASERKIPIVAVDRAKLDEMAGGIPHQGIIAMAAQKEYVSIEDILAIAAERGEKPLVVIADGINDPYNLGAVIRCADCAGAHGIIIPKRRSSGLTPVVTKASAGALAHMAVARVASISSALEILKNNGVWIFGAEAGGTPYYETDFNCGVGLVLGSEGEGISKLVLERCDFITSIPMYGKVNSLNVSTAAAVILCEVARNRAVK